MKQEIIVIENLKCEGCKNTIIKAVQKLKGISSVAINLENSEVVIEKNGEILRESIIEKLAKLGYPEEGNSNLIHKAKSYVSCAIGRIKS